MKKGFLGSVWVLSILAGTIFVVCHEWIFDRNEIDMTLPENWKRMPAQERLDSLDGFLSKNETFFLISKITQLRIRSHLRKMILSREDQLLRDGVRYSLGFRYRVGWMESGLLGLAGFASVWLIYGSVAIAILLVPALPMVHFPYPRLKGVVETLNLPAGRAPAGLTNVRITLFGFLALDEHSKRPKKPGAAWID